MSPSENDAIEALSNRIRNAPSPHGGFPPLPRSLDSFRNWFWHSYKIQPIRLQEKILGEWEMNFWTWFFGRARSNWSLPQYQCIPTTSHEKRLLGSRVWWFIALRFRFPTTVCKYNPYASRSEAAGLFLRAPELSKAWYSLRRTHKQMLWNDSMLCFKECRRPNSWPES